MILENRNYALLVCVNFIARTPLMIRSGQEGEVSDSSLKRTPDGRLNINGYVWASLIRRALSRCEAGKDYAAAWGKYEAKTHGIAPLWTTPTFIPPTGFIPDINYGNRIDRDFGSVADEALYSDEIALVHQSIPCRFKVYLENKDNVAPVIKALAEALWVVDQGIETIGGGWSYGMGRLTSPREFKYRTIDMSDEVECDDLWKYEPETTWESYEISHATIAEGRNWNRFTVEASILNGQLLAIHSTVPPLDYAGDEQPDTFVYSRPRYIEEGIYKSEKVITGKSFRQAILSQEIERELRSTNVIGACLNSSDGKRTPRKTDKSEKRLCLCNRCLWFGDSSGGGIISVADAVVEGIDNTQIIYRQQLCEHSNQNVQLFNGEYLIFGNFNFDILIDHSRPDCCPDELEEAVKRVLAGMMPEKDSKEVREKRWKPTTVNAELIEPEFFAPEGWCRLGATSSCTGQVSVTKVEVIGRHHV